MAMNKSGVRARGYKSRAKAAMLVVLASVMAVTTVTAELAVAAPLTNVSPNPRDVYAGSTQGGMSHMLKKETVANVPDLKAAAYYPIGTTGAGKSIRIRYGVDGKKCYIVNSVLRESGNNATVNVRLTGARGDVRRYSIPLDRVCSNIGSPPRNNVEGTSRGWQNNRFFGNFALPDRLIRDDETGRSKVEIDIAYSLGERGDRTYVHRGTSMENTFNFTLNANGTGARVAIIGGTRSNQFGLRSAFIGSGVRDVRGLVRFGLPCGERSTTFAVSLFDADTDIFGTTYLWVTENGTRLPRNRYTVVPARDLVGRWDSANRRWESTGGTNETSRLVVNRARVDAVYEFGLANPYQRGFGSPNGNVLSVGVPYDAIYADIGCDFNLEPGINLDTDTYSGTPDIEVTGTVSKDGGGIANTTHPWDVRAVRFSSRPNENIGGNSRSSDPCARVPLADRISGCDEVSSDRYPADDERTTRYTSGGPDAAGTYLCFFTRVQNPTDGAGDDDVWRYSDMDCAVVGATPKVQVWGYDARVLGSINTSLERRSGDTLGSWGEYGVMANGPNAGMASGAGLLGGGSESQADWSELTFSNTPDFGNFGGLAPYVHTMNADTTSAGLSLGATDFSAGTRRVVRVNGTLFINGDLRYGNGATRYSSVTEIPRVVYVADDIVIAPGVNRIDPWLVALDDGGNSQGRISTCSSVRDGSNYFVPMVDADLTVDTCDESIRFNSPVIANQIFLYRTAGSAAEVFNMRADVFLSSLVGSPSTRPVATTDTIVELPPRF